MRVITLSNWEKNVFDFLCAAADNLNKSRQGVELRVVGGWVRDKLLGRKTNDIDAVVIRANASQFAYKLREYSKDLRDLFENGESSTPLISTIIPLASGNEASKQIETARVQIDGRVMDLVQLRTKGLVDSSDVEHVEEALSYDALKRDFTINSLFYNVQTADIEDPTGQGLKDLSDKIIRTPIDAKLTMRDDPLRALRAVRFSCELGFDICASMHLSLKDPDLQQKLGSEVSKERIGAEIIRCIKADPMKAVQLIHMFGMNRALFGFEKHFEESMERVKNALFLALHSGTVEKFGPHDQIVLVLACLLWNTNLVKSELHDGLRLSKKIQNDVEKIIRLGKQLGKIGCEWRRARISNLTQDEDLWVKMARLVQNAGEPLWPSVSICASLQADDRTFLNELNQCRISVNLCQIHPCLDGHILQNELSIQPGPTLGEALKDLMKLQLLAYRRNGNVTSTDSEAESYLHILKSKFADQTLNSCRST
ncbi:unnamed protein product [Agarophyton chilense]|eukprot:gb/GEZJ01003947.1/.p1 GENE.gb/GEZJ01003947.1/~~gb/GEZJ01003947.1/.p1  ORF type:complete len:483 (+),score=71.58 gb/GEZJ01003947.1/:270-1718(+)